jgi:hypothetical protein
LHCLQIYEKKALVLATGMFATKVVEDYLSRVAQFRGSSSGP